MGRVFSELRESVNMDKDAALAELSKRNLQVDQRHFIEAIKQGDSDVVALYLEAGFEASSRTSEGTPVAVVASARRGNPVAGLLLDRMDRSALLDALANVTPSEDARQEREKGKDVWDRVQVVTTSIAALLVPLVLGVVGAFFNDAVKQREIGQQLVQLSVDILKVDPGLSAQPGGLRDWAIEVLSHNSQVALPEGARESLRTGPLPGVDRTLALLATLKKSTNLDDSTYASAALNAIFVDAVQGGRTTLAERLVEMGVSPDAADSSGTSALTYAALSGRDDIAALLVRKGADVRKANQYGDTPLIIAARDNRAAILKALLVELPPSDRDHVNKDGVSALLVAVRESNEECVRLLLTAGAPATSAMIDLARQQGNKQILSLLESKKGE